ncbi:hypothetical protein KUTeg_017846 [Tegillarca granosa]|uniref:Adaptor-related protein complex 5 beta subunit n=1 Tax=Tegillarca granosa TaxID=220873 RepID=A0ABQ9EG51_TEGGR|nr:hypothetical protein KUTeg_017846 [Tegillarca granosa]
MDMKKPGYQSSSQRIILLIFYPSVFDPLDCQLAKLCMFNLCFEPLTTTPSDTAAALLLSSLGHLHKLVWHTGSDRPAVALFRALFHMYHRHCSKTFSQDINRFLRGLISGFPYFIPNALDFIEGLRETTPDSPVYLEILKLLHTQVVFTPEEQAAIYYHFYLQVLKRASLQKEIPPQKTVKFLSYLAENSIMVDDGSWRLGNGILAVCQNLLICHGTENLYLEIGDLLFYMMTRYIDTDIQDRAMFYYTLLTSATDAKIAALLKTVSGTQSFNQALSTLLPENNDQERCSQVHILDEPVLDWQRIKMDIIQQNEESNIYDKNKDDNSDLMSYLEDLNTTKFVISATYSLKIKDVSFQNIYAITVHIDTGESYEDIKDINITSLSCNEAEEININIFPIKPVPSKFSSWIEFVKDKKTYRSNLPDIVLTLTDIMTPLQSDSKGDLYKELWKKLTQGSKQNGTKCIQSVKIIHKDQTEFEEVIKDNLNHYRVVDETDTSVVKFGMFLPPSYHLLLHCHGNSKHMVVFMVTDFPSVLPYIDHLLSSL